MTKVTHGVESVLECYTSRVINEQLVNEIKKDLTEVVGKYLDIEVKVIPVITKDEPVYAEKLDAHFVVTQDSIRDRVIISIDEECQF